MSASTAKLLKAASEIVGGDKLLADRLGISEALLLKFMADSCGLPDPLLLRAVDIILEDRLAGDVETPQNYSRGSGATFRAGTG